MNPTALVLICLWGEGVAGEEWVLGFGMPSPLRVPFLDDNDNMANFGGQWFDLAGHSFGGDGRSAFVFRATMCREFGDRMVMHVCDLGFPPPKIFRS